MIAVECHIDIVYSCYKSAEWSSKLILKIDSVTFFNVAGTINSCLLDSNDHLRSRHTVCFFRHQVDIDDISNLHVAYCKVESRDHHSCSAYEFKRLPSVIWRIELLTVIICADIVDFYSLSCILRLEVKLRFSASRASAASAGLVAASAAAACFMMMIMAFLMMMITVYSGIDKFSSQECLDSSISIAFSSCTDFDPCLCQCVLQYLTLRHGLARCAQRR